MGNQLMRQNNMRNKNGSPCEDQKSFNKALRNAIEYNREKDMEEGQVAMWVLLALWLLLIVWAVNVVSDMPRGANRVLHGTAAIVASPAYLIAHYLGREQRMSASL